MQSFLKTIAQRYEDPIEQLMYEEYFYEDLVGNWLNNMKKW